MAYFCSFLMTQLNFMYIFVLLQFTMYMFCVFHLYVHSSDLWSQWDVNFYKLSWPLRFRIYTAHHRFRASGHVYVLAEWRWSISGTCLSYTCNTLSWCLPGYLYTVLDLCHFLLMPAREPIFLDLHHSPWCLPGDLYT